MSNLTVGALVHDFFLDYLSQQKGLRQSSVRSYRDTLRLFLPFVANDARRRISRLQLEDLSLERVLAFLRHMEQDRHNSIPTRNQRLAALRTFFEYLGRRSPEALHLCQQVAAIPTKRTPLPDTRFIARDQVQGLFERLPTLGRFALRDRVLLLFLYNTGARVQEVADLRIAHLTLERPPSVRLHGKGDKWRHCPLWQETAEQLALLLGRRASDPDGAVFVSGFGAPADALRDLQACAPPDRRRRDHRRRRRATARLAARLAAHGRRPSSRSRCRSQRHPWLARSRQPQHHASLRRDHDAHEDRGHDVVRTASLRRSRLPPCAVAGGRLAP